MKYTKLLFMVILLLSALSLVEARSYYIKGDSRTYVYQGPGYTVYHYDSPNSYYRYYYDDDEDHHYRNYRYDYDDDRVIYYGYNYDGQAYYNGGKYYYSNYKYYQTYYDDDYARENLYYSVNGYRNDEVKTCTTYNGQTKCFYMN